MSHSVVSIEIPVPQLQDVEALAAKSGMSVEAWIGMTLAERVRFEQVSERFFRNRNAEAAGKTLLDILDTAPDCDPIPGDEL